MLATEKQINCINVIYTKINVCDEFMPKQKDRASRDLCINDYCKIYVHINNKTLTKSQASKFISTWIDFSKSVYLKPSDGLRLGNECREVGLYCESDLFLTEMFY